MNNNHGNEKEQCMKRMSPPFTTLRNSKRRFCTTNHSKEESNGSSVSTTLTLYDDPWKIKKTLTDSDIGILNRLMLAADLVKKQIFPMFDEDHARAADTADGFTVKVWDLDTKSMHHLILKRWSSSKSYVLIGRWNRDFVWRRELKKGDEIGFHWDPYNCSFNFRVLKRAMQQN